MIKRRRLNTLLRRFEAATREHAMLGGQPPEDWDAIEEDFRVAKKRLHDAIKTLYYELSQPRD